MNFANNILYFEIKLLLYFFNISKYVLKKNIFIARSTMLKSGALRRLKENRDGQNISVTRSQKT